MSTVRGMVKGWLLAIVIASVACTEQAPVHMQPRDTCIAAVDAYYGAGCTYWVGDGSGGTVPLPHDAMVGVCESASERPGCGYTVELLRLCAEHAAPPICPCGEQLAMMLWCL